MSELPAGWALATVADVADVVLGQSPPGSSYNVAREGLPFFQGKAEFGDLTPTVVKWTTAPRKEALEGDVLISVRAPVGPTNLAPGHCAIGRGLAALRPSAAITTRYLFWVMRATAPALREGSTGTTFEAISGAQLRAHRVPVAPLAEQERIVAAIEEHFSRLDAASALLAAAVARLRRYGASLVAEATEGDWPVHQLGEHTVDQRYGSSAKTSRGGDVPVLRMGNIVNGALDYSDLKYLPADHPDLGECLLQPGDVLFNRTNSPELVGKSAVFEGEDRLVAFASYLIRVRLDDAIDPRWAATVLNGPDGRRYIERVRTQQVGQANVNGTKLKEFPIPVPPRDTQHERLARLDTGRAWMRRVTDEVARAQRRVAQLRQAILAAGFSGRLVEQDPADEPGSGLLERIATEATGALTSQRRAAS